LTVTELMYFVVICDQISADNIGMV